MMPFLLKSVLSMLVLLGVYHLFLEKEKMHRFNRFYLLGAMVLSIVLPLISIPVYVEAAAVLQPVAIAQAQALPTTFVPAVVQEEHYMPYVLAGGYAVIVVVLGVRFILNINRFYRLKKKSTTVGYKNATLVLLEDNVLPHTFLNNIYLSKHEYESRKIEPELFTHELAHVLQKHTLDILFTELLKTFFWFNPLVYFYKRAIQLNHEFLADETTVSNHLNITNYQQLLLEMATPAKQYALASSINFSVTKKRFIMMTKTTTKTKAVLLKVALLPVIGTLMMLFCTKATAQKNALGNLDPKKVKSINVFSVSKPEMDSVKAANPTAYKGEEDATYKKIVYTYTGNDNKETVKTEYVKNEPVDAKDNPFPELENEIAKLGGNENVKGFDFKKLTDEEVAALRKTDPVMFKEKNKAYTRVTLKYVDAEGKAAEKTYYEKSQPASR
jgi:hypothetical protein